MFDEATDQYRIAPSVLNRLAAHQWPETSFLALLSARERADLLALGRARHYAAREQMLVQGDDAQHLLVIVRGASKTFASAANGRHSVLSLRGPGDLLGEMAYFTGGMRSASVTALIKTEAISISATRFREFVATHPSATHYASKILSDRLRAANARREQYNAFSAPARAAHVLADVAAQWGRPVDGGLELGAAYTQADLASLASVSRRTFEKILKSFESAGLVVRQRRRLIIPDPAALRAGAQT